MAATEQPLSQGEKLAIQAALQEAERRGIDVSGVDNWDQPQAWGPQTDDELWQAVLDLTGYRLARVAVCGHLGHVAPFTIFSDLYFERRTDVLMIGNRGGGKTTLSGFLHGAKGRYNPGYTTAIAGAIDKQSDRAYKEFKRFITKLGEEIVDTLQKETEWLHGGTTEVLAGTVRSCNGPHPVFAQFDELELIQSLDVFDEWQNMSQSDAHYQGQQLLSSTRKRPYGLVQTIVKECEVAIKAGDTPPWDVMTFCIFETMRNQPNCGKKNKDGSLKCGCDKVKKGEMPDGSPRTFDKVCKGRGKKSDGHIALTDVHRRFRGLSKRVFEAQQECLRPSAEGLVHAWWDPDTHGLPVWYPRPEYGSVYRSWDWGGANEHSVHFSQVLDVPVKLILPDRMAQQVGRDEILLMEGTIITFDEIFHAGGGFGELGLEVFRRTKEWAKFGFDFDVTRDFCDPAGRTAKVDVTNAATENNYPEPDWRSIPSSIELGRENNSLEKHLEWGEDGRLYVVTRMCPNLVEEYETYHWPEKKEGMPPPRAPVKSDDHAVDDQRYLIWNLYKLGLRADSGEAPAAEYHSSQTRTRAKEAQARKEGRQVHGTASQDTPASTMSPEYTRRHPEVSQSTVRRFDVPTIRQLD